MVGDMENYKIKVDNEAESKEAQNLFSYLGYNRRPYLLTNEKMREDGYQNDYEIGFLFAEQNGYVSCTQKTSTTYFDDHRFKEITLQQLKDLVVLKRNSIDDARFKDIFGDIWYVDSTNSYWMFENGIWREAEEPLFKLEPIKKLSDKEVKMKEHIAKVSGDWRLVDSHELVSGRIEVPDGAEEYRANYKFYKNNGELFYCSSSGEWTKSIMSSISHNLQSTRIDAIV